jgi:hypothetical protein
MSQPRRLDEQTIRPLAPQELDERELRGQPRDTAHTTARNLADHDPVAHPRANREPLEHRPVDTDDPRLVDQHRPPLTGGLVAQ